VVFVFSRKELTSKISLKINVSCLFSIPCIGASSSFPVQSVASGLTSHTIINIYTVFTAVQIVSNAKHGRVSTNGTKAQFA
jgi:hypothetical protein